MNTIDWEEYVEGRFTQRPLAATIGVFDGIHKGHRKLIERVLARHPATPVAFTFTESPKKILRPSSYSGDIQTRSQKLEGFEALGIELCVLIDFSGNFSKLTGRDFLSRLHVRDSLESLAVGSDFRCGHRLDTDASAIAEFFKSCGVGVDIVTHVLLHGHPVSSSRIRSAISEGRLTDAADMLGRPFELDLRGSEFVGSDFGNVRVKRPATLVLPPAGEYEAVYFDDGGGRELIVRITKHEIALEGIRGKLPNRISFQGLAKE